MPYFQANLSCRDCIRYQYVHKHPVSISLSFLVSVNKIVLTVSVATNNFHSFFAFYQNIKHFTNLRHRCLTEFYIYLSRVFTKSLLGNACNDIYLPR